MKRFRFRLQTLLEYRTRQLESAQQVFAQEALKAQAISERIDACDAQMAQALEDQSGLGVIHPESVAIFANYLVQVRQEKQRQQAALQVQNTVVDAERDRLKDALLRQKALENLKKTHHQRYRTLLEKVEAMALEELAQNRFLAEQRRRSKEARWKLLR